jgi:hypothetical protein
VSMCGLDLEIPMTPMIHRTTVRLVWRKESLCLRILKKKEMPENFRHFLYCIIP